MRNRDGRSPAQDLAVDGHRACASLPALLQMTIAESH
jgi:hypothetical protein